MPYISAGERPAIDTRVEALAEEISRTIVRGANKETEISVHYRRAILEVADTLISRLEEGRRRRTTRKGDRKKSPNHKNHAQSLALEILGEPWRKKKDGGAWLGRLNYAMTRLIQVVPEKLVERGEWKEAFRYWVYAQTVGALTRSAMDVHASGGDGWAADGVVGVLIDVKDEYKRRVNAAYETFQIRRAGDCYSTRYRTQLSEVKDAEGRVAGYTEVMKDFGVKAS